MPRGFHGELRIHHARFGQFLGLVNDILIPL